MSSAESRGGRPRTRPWDSTRKECTISVRADTYAKLREAADRRGVAIGAVVAEMLERAGAEHAEGTSP